MNAVTAILLIAAAMILGFALALGSIIWGFSTDWANLYWIIGLCTGGLALGVTMLMVLLHINRTIHKNMMLKAIRTSSGVMLQQRSPQVVLSKEALFVDAQRYPFRSFHLKLSTAEIHQNPDGIYVLDMEFISLANYSGKRHRFSFMLPTESVERCREIVQEWKDNSR